LLEHLPDAAVGIDRVVEMKEIIETAKKLGVSAFEYLTNFLSGNRTMVPLAQIIAQKKENGALVF
jgi:hypothetical protein